MWQLVGDIVRVRYVASLVENQKVVMSTKNVLGRPWVEFVLGIDQVIKGFDRALPLMSVGERSTIIMSPEYACKYVFLYLSQVGVVCLFDVSQGYAYESINHKYMCVS